MLFDPAAAAPTDPAAEPGTVVLCKGHGQNGDRTEWSASASMFTFISSFLTVGHQHGYSGMFGFNRKNEWLTKELTQYGADNKAIASNSTIRCRSRTTTFPSRSSTRNGGRST